jgi:hypothetical protein
MAERSRKREVVDAEEVERRYYEADEIPDEEVTDLFAEAQQEGRRENVVLEKLSRNPVGSPELSGGDIDAAWDRADEGEETVGGSSPTPDQDVVDEIGEAVGLTYQDNEPLTIDEKLAKRDATRWELNPASAEDYAIRTDLSRQEDQDAEHERPADDTKDDEGGRQTR